MSSYLNTNQNLECLDLNTGNITCANLQYSNLTSGTLETTLATIPNLAYTNITTGTLQITGMTSANTIHTNASTGSLSFSNTIDFIPAANKMHSTNVFKLTGVTDSVATTMFSITTTDETGSTDAGVYTVNIWGMIHHGGNSVSATSTACTYFISRFSRAMLASGTGVTSTPVSELGTVAAINGDTGITSATITAVETTEFQTDVQINVDLSGTSVTTAVITVYVEVISNGFLTHPVTA